MARRHESLIPLSREHHDALLLAWRLRTGDLSKREPELRAKHVSAFFEYRLINHLKLDLLLSDHRELRAKAAAIKAGAHDQVDSFCVLLERPYPDRGASTVRTSGESDELHGDGGAGAGR
jgi:hypothetical protein